MERNRQWNDYKEVNGYTILHGNDTNINLESDSIEENINGAILLDNGANVQHKKLSQHTNVEGYLVGKWEIVFKQGSKMGEVLDRVPYGVIDKSITGLGATTLELLTEVRNSIVVVPTKSLAYNKTIWINAKKDSHYCMYIGSPIKEYDKEITLKSVKEYIQARSGHCKKFMVVADSLPMLINYLENLGEEIYQDYFLMVDEIDTMQIDSAYRPRLEGVIDYYFLFKYYNRAVVSATLRHFSDARLNKEAYLKIKWEEQPQRDISIVYTNHIETSAWRLINHKLYTGSRKILVAYNYLDGIINIIKHLEVPESDCCILCSERNIDKIKTLTETSSEKALDSKGHLRGRVTFMTCAYFAGIDIQDKCDLIVLSSHLQPFTYLSSSRLSQIAGRCRNGLLSETILYDIPDTQRNYKYSTSAYFQSIMVKRAKKYAEILNDMAELTKLDTNTLPLKEFMEPYMRMVSKKKATPRDYPLPIIRQHTITEQYMPAYFNIDALTEMWELRSHLYSNKGNLIQVLGSQNRILSIREDSIPSEEHQLEELQSIKVHNHIRIEREAEILKTKLIKWYQDKGNNYKLAEIRRETDKRLQDSIIEPFTSLHPYYPVNTLLDMLTQRYRDERKLRNFVNAAYFHALPLEHPFKATLLMEYKVDIETLQSKHMYNKEERIAIMRRVLAYVCHYKYIVSDKFICELTGSFLNMARSGKGYRVRGLNPFNLPSVITTLPLCSNVMDWLMIPKRSYK